MKNLKDMRKFFIRENESFGYKIGMDIDSGNFYINETFDYYDWKPATVEKTASFIRRKGSFFALFKDIKRQGLLQEVKEVFKGSVGGTSVSKALSIILEREGLSLHDIGEFVKFLLDFGMDRREVEAKIEKKVNYWLNMELNIKLYKELEDEEEVEEDEEEVEERVFLPCVAVSIDFTDNVYRYQKTKTMEILVLIDQESNKVETIFDDGFACHHKL